MYDWLYYSQVAHGYMCKICEIFYRKSSVPTGRRRCAWSHNTVIFHGNVGKMLRRHANSKPRSDVILAITSTRIDEVLSGAIGFQEKTKMFVPKLIQIVYFLGKHSLSIEELYQPFLRFLAFDLEEPILKQYLKNCLKNATYDSHATANSLISALNEFIKKNGCKT